ncbi:MAG TPA: histidine kinase [Cyclobacteriaceae bacterium]|nr:histidine kinase [Cyclobacteriaceae bacterium]
MSAFADQKKLPILLHISAWLLLGMLLFFLNPLAWKVSLPDEFWARQCILLVMLAGVFYLNEHILVPRFLFIKGKIWLFLAIVLTITLMLMLTLQQVELWLNLPELLHKAFRPNVPYVPKRHLFTMDVFTIMTTLLCLGVSTSVATVKKWQTDEALRRQLEEERVNSELSYLKAQINPHFFFNTLNNIYALTSIDIDRARMALHKLSRMMRYVLYETEKDRTLLSKEVDFIKDFITLMRLRISEKVQITLDIQEQFTDTIIAPMLLLPFIENCFKHGISSQQESKIVIRLSLENQTLHLYTSNTIAPSHKASVESQSRGIGLINTKRRLSLIYPAKHTLAIDDANAENEYRVHLKIDLKWN